MLRYARFAVVAALLAQFASTSGFAQSVTATTYQGRLTDGSGPVNGTVTLEFSLFDRPIGGVLVAGPVVVPGVMVTDGLFTADLDFGSRFAESGKGGWVEIEVDSGQGPVTLSPRQRVAPAPLALGLVSRESVDVGNTNAPFGQPVGGGGGDVTAFVTFQAQSSGRLAGVVFRANGNLAYTPTFFGDVYAGQGEGNGAFLGSVAQPVPITQSETEFTIDLSALDIDVTAGAWYTVTVLCGVNFTTTLTPSDLVQGVSSSNQPANWWFKSLLQAPTRTLVSDAANARNARGLNADSKAAMNGYELLLQDLGNQNSGLGHFDFTRNFGGFAPNGPVLFGDEGGGLGTRQNGQENIALRWERDGSVRLFSDIFVPRNLQVDTFLTVVGNASVGGNFTSFGRVGIGQGASQAGYRLELPNTAGPAGQGRANGWVTYSSRKFKDQIETFPDALATINKLRGVTFVWNAPLPDGTLKHDIGFIAEEVAQAAPELVTRTEDGNATGLDYGKVVPITVEAIKAQQRALDALRVQNADLLARLEKLEQGAKGNR